MVSFTLFYTTRPCPGRRNRVVILTSVRLFLLVLLPVYLIAQTPVAGQAAKELDAALVGTWAGTLEYRDYSEPPTSNKRVKLPTWLTVSHAGDNLRFDYVYDDGPSKTVKESLLVHVDVVSAVYTTMDSAGKLEDTYKIAGVNQHRSGRGVLTLTGMGTENGKPVEVRTTLRVGRSIFEVVRETASTGQPFTFRHSYTMVRSAAP